MEEWMDQQWRGGREKRMPENAHAAPSAITPHLVAQDAAAAIAFYERAFGATVLFRMDTPDGSKIVHSTLSLNGGVILLCDDFSKQNDGRPAAHTVDRAVGITLHLNVADVDASWNRAIEAGATVVMPLDDMFRGDRYGIVADPFGHRWSLSTPQRTATEDELKAGGEKYAPTEKFTLLPSYPSL
jgi:PhnB protein